MVSCSPQVLRAGKFMPSQTPKAEQDWLWLSLENPEISRVWLGTLGVQVTARGVGSCSWGPAVTERAGGSSRVKGWLEGPELQMRGLRFV